MTGPTVSASFLRDWSFITVRLFKSLFSEARIFARLKLAAFASYLLFVGVGLVLKLTGAEGTATGIAEFILESPDAVQILGGLIALVFVISANIYTRQKRRAWQLKLLRMASAPSITADVRLAILRTLEE